jgi:predicted dehydrogenase
VNNTPKRGLTRREVIKQSGQVAVASALAGALIPQVHAAETNTIQIVLVGCGGRGTGAAANALSVPNGPTKLVAMADAFSDRLRGSFEHLKKNEHIGKHVEVPEDRKFVGFDAYKKAIDCLKPGDVAIFATPPAFRWVHFTYAIQKGVNVFMEKPVAVDGPSCKKMFKLAEESEKKGMKVGVGLMCRHCDARGELFNRIQNGAIGEPTLLQAYRMAGVTAMEFSGPDHSPKPAQMSDLEYQIRRFHSFLWASGGAFSDFLIHNIDESCWMKNAWPVRASGYGGRHYRGTNIDQNFDSYTVEYTYKDGTKFYLEGRSMNGCEGRFASYAMGTKGAAVISTAGHMPAGCRIYNTHRMFDDKDGKVMPSSRSFLKEGLVWRFEKPEPDPYQLEWNHLIQAIRADKAYNEAKRGTEASLVTAMGRMACHTGQPITWDQILNCEHEFAPDLDKLTLESPAPLLAGSDGKYPVPQPGIKTKREF